MFGSLGLTSAGLNNPPNEHCDHCGKQNVFLPRASRCDVHAKVSSMFTISLALVSMNPYPLLRAQSKPSRAPTCRMLCRSHLLPATMHIGNVAPLSNLVSRSTSISWLKYSNCCKVLACVMSYTSRNASEVRLDADQRPRYSSCPAVSVSEREYVVPSIVRVTEYESSMVGSYLP